MSDSGVGVRASTLVPSEQDEWRPNQVLPVGGLPLALLPAARCRQVLARDSAYHQGTVWPWLIGPFIEAWVKCRGATPQAKAAARTRFFEPACAQLARAGVGHISEMADADAPHEARGCPFQAWSASELLRVERQVLSRETRRQG